MVKLENISLRNYGPLHLVAGDVFEATHQHAMLLIAIGKARRYEEAIEKPQQRIRKFEIQEVPPPADHVVISPRTGKPKRSYKRKDMVAE